MPISKSALNTGCSGFFLERIFIILRPFTSQHLAAIGCTESDWGQRSEWTLRSLARMSSSPTSRGWVAVNWEKNTIIFLEHPITDVGHFCNWNIPLFCRSVSHLLMSVYLSLAYTCSMDSHQQDFWHHLVID